MIRTLILIIITIWNTYGDEKTGTTAFSLRDVGITYSDIYETDIDTGKVTEKTKLVPILTLSEQWAASSVLEKIDKKIFKTATYVGRVNIYVTVLENSDVIYWYEILLIPEKTVLNHPSPKRIKAVGKLTENSAMLLEIASRVVSEVADDYKIEK